MQLFSNNATSQTSNAFNIGDTNLVVDNGSYFPTPGINDYFNITVENVDGEFENMRCTSRIGNALTVVRATEAPGNVELDFDAGSRVEIRATAASLENFLQRDDDVIDGGTF